MQYASVSEYVGLVLRGPRNVILERFLTFIQRHPHRPVSIKELCVATGCKERTLRAVCVKHFGMSPTRYLHLRRMRLVRQALVLGNAKVTTVTKIALAHRFSELGRFSGAYRRIFGEAPSASLHRAFPLTTRAVSQVRIP